MFFLVLYTALVDDGPFITNSYKALYLTLMKLSKFNSLLCY